MITIHALRIDGRSCLVTGDGVEAKALSKRRCAESHGERHEDDRHHRQDDVLGIARREPGPAEVHWRKGSGEADDPIRDQP